jgi:hypothetical protein
VHQEHVGDLGETLEGFVVALHEGLAVGVGAGHHQGQRLGFGEPGGAGGRPAASWKSR